MRGLIVSPDNIRNQFEGAAVFGTSLALFGEITATNGAIDQSNFNNYQITRMNRAPRHVDVEIVKSDAPPAGVGEPGSSTVCSGIVQRGVCGYREARAGAAPGLNEVGVKTASDGRTQDAAGRVSTMVFFMKELFSALTFRGEFGQH